MFPEYESERRASRSEVAAVLNGLTEGLIAGTVRIGDDSDFIELDVPDELSLEFELEPDDDTISLELELEWPRPDEQTEGTAEEPATEPTDADVERPVSIGSATDLETLARFELFRDERDEWRWRLRHRNGNIIATSGQGYSRKHNARKGLMSVVRNAPSAAVTEDLRQ